MANIHVETVFEDAPDERNRQAMYRYESLVTVGGEPAVPNRIVVCEAGTLLAVQTEKQPRITLYRNNDPAPYFHLEDDAPPVRFTWCEFSPDGGALWAVAEQKVGSRLLRWSTESGSRDGTAQPLDGRSYDGALSPSGNRLALFLRRLSAKTNQLLLFDTTRDPIERPIQLNLNEGFLVAFERRGPLHLLLRTQPPKYVTFPTPEDFRIICNNPKKLLDAADLQIPKTLPTQMEGRVSCADGTLALLRLDSPHRMLLLRLSDATAVKEYPTMCLWEGQTQVGSARTCGSTVAFGERLVASDVSENCVGVWDSWNGKRLDTIALPADAGELCTVTLWKDQFLFVGTKAGVLLRWKLSYELEALPSPSVVPSVAPQPKRSKKVR